MQIDRRQLAFPVLALGLLSAVPAFAGADEDAIAKNLEAFRAAQAAGNTEVIASICAEELSYSHSNAKIDTKASLLNGIATANYKWTSLEYKDPTIRIVGPAAIVRYRASIRMRYLFRFSAVTRNFPPASMPVQYHQDRCRSQPRNILVSTHCA